MTDTNLEKAREMEDPPSCEWCGAMAGCLLPRCPAMQIYKLQEQVKSTEAALEAGRNGEARYEMEKEQARRDAVVEGLRMAADECATIGLHQSIVAGIEAATDCMDKLNALANEMEGK